nr:CoA-transferase [Saprospiraceae bacterium]
YQSFPGPRGGEWMAHLVKTTDGKRYDRVVQLDVKGKPNECTIRFDKDGKMYVMEEAFKADFAIVKAWKGDEAGNLIFKGTARNFNPCMCGAAKITVAEVEELVPLGSTDF